MIRRAELVVCNEWISIGINICKFNISKTQLMSNLNGHELSKEIPTTRQHLLITPQPRESLRSSLEAGVVIRRAELVVHT